MGKNGGWALCESGKSGVTIASDIKLASRSIQDLMIVIGMNVMTVGGE